MADWFNPAFLALLAAQGIVLVLTVNRMLFLLAELSSTQMRIDSLISSLKNHG